MDVHEACAEFVRDVRFVPDVSRVVSKYTGLNER